MGYSREFLLGEGLDGFRGYWCPLPGRKAHKLDWDQTYCNRMRERVDRGRLTGQARAGPRQEPLFKNPYIAVMAEKHGISTHEHREASNITIDADPAESAGASHDRQLAFSDPVSEGGKLARFYSRNADKR